MLPVAILAGGLATRLRPITEVMPKALIEVAGRPFIERQLTYLHAQGVSNVVLCVGYLGELIYSVVGSGEQFGLEVRYSFDGSSLLGTGGALKKALPLLGNHFFVLYGDSYLLVNFAEVQNAYIKSGKPALMTILKNDDRWDKSNVLFSDGQIIEYNKRQPLPEMMHVDYGLGLMSKAVFDQYPIDSSFDLADVYRSLSVQGQLAGFESTKRFYEIGSYSGLKEAESYFSTEGKL